MRQNLRHPLLSILCLGLVNVLIWRYGLGVLGLTARTFLLAGAWAFAAGWLTGEKPLFTTTTMLTAPLVIAGGYHGRPWEWLIIPPLWPYFVMNFGPLVLAYLVVVRGGYALKRKSRRSGASA